jgi:hypothetical protein
MVSNHNLVWYEPHPAPATLPAQEQVTPWRFACHFLAEFEQWRQAAGRWAQLFGADKHPGHWRRTQERCGGLARRIVEHPGFRQAMIADGVSQRLLGQSDLSFEPTVEGAFERIMFDQERSVLIELFSADVEFVKSLPGFPHKDELRTRLHRQFSEFPSTTVSILEWHLCRYRNAMLQASCLQPESAAFWPTHLFLEKQYSMKVTDMIGANQTLGIQMTEELNSVLNTMEDLIASLGFDGAWEQLTSDDFETLPAGRGRGGRQPINVIPSEGRITACTSTVLALFKVAASRKPATGFRNIMSELRTHLVDCHPTTQNAILITDWWNAKSFAEEHFSELAAWRRKGVQIIVLLVSEPGSTLTPLRIWL